MFFKLAMQRTISSTKRRSITARVTHILKILRPSWTRCFRMTSLHRIKVSGDWRLQNAGLMMTVVFSDIRNEDRERASSARSSDRSVRIRRIDWIQTPCPSIFTWLPCYYWVCIVFSTPKTLLTIYDRYRLSTGASERIQFTALLAAFKNAVELSAKTPWKPVALYLFRSSVPIIFNSYFYAPAKLYDLIHCKMY